MKTQARTSTAFAANKCGCTGLLLLSTIGLVALSLLGFWRFDVIRYATASSLLGAVVSAVGLFWEPRRRVRLSWIYTYTQQTASFTLS
jgi:hypothetical protein